MNGRTCQLCGKPLSKIWSGGGGDFCSREHRSQYRLRVGMDTLQEANKHASLMRRRDHLRQFPSSRLQCNTAISPRSFGPLAAPVSRMELRRSPSRAVLATLKIESGEPHFVSRQGAGASKGRSSAHPRPSDKTGFRAAGRIMHLPARACRMPVALSRAELVRIHFHLRMDAGGRRSFGIRPQAPRRAFLSATAFHLSTGEPIGSLAGTQLRKLLQTGKIGHAFRVSGSTGFRVPAMTRKHAALAQASGGGMIWPESFQLRGAAYIGLAVEPFSGAVEMPVSPARLPLSRGGRSPVGLSVAQAIPLRRRAPLLRPLETHTSDSVSLASGARQLMIRSHLRAGQSSVGSGAKVVKLRPAGSPPDRREEHAPFQPQEQVCINISYSWNSSGK